MSSLILALEHTFIPLSAIIATVAVIGLLGNGVSFYIFYWRFPTSGFNSLMAALAAFDFIACLVHMPLDIVTFFPVGETTRSYLCKVTCFQLAFTATGSAMILMAIAFTRYFGIMKPLLGTLSVRMAGHLILGTCLMAVGLSLPITILFGEGRIITDANVTTALCAVEKKYMNTSAPLMYYWILAGLYIATFIVHTYLYARCVHTVWNRRRIFTSMKGTTNVVILTPRTSRGRQAAGGSSVSPSSTLSRVTEEPISPTSAASIGQSDTDEMGTTTNYGTIDGRQEAASTICKEPLKRLQPKRVATLQSEAPSPSSTLTSAGRGSPGRKGAGHTNTSYRVLGVVIAISLTYFLSYAPHFGVMFYLFSHDMTVFEASAQNLGFELLMRSFFLNNILDPLIYGLLSIEFRKELRRTLAELKSSLTTGTVYIILFSLFGFLSFKVIQVAINPIMCFTYMHNMLFSNSYS